MARRTRRAGRWVTACFDPEGRPPRSTTVAREPGRKAVGFSGNARAVADTPGQHPIDARPEILGAALHSLDSAAEDAGTSTSADATSVFCTSAGHHAASFLADLHLRGPAQRCHTTAVVVLAPVALVGRQPLPWSVVGLPGWRLGRPPGAPLTGPWRSRQAAAGSIGRQRDSMRWPTAANAT
jgi:hypothetical protein